MSQGQDIHHDEKVFVSLHDAKCGYIMYAMRRFQHSIKRAR